MRSQIGSWLAGWTAPGAQQYAGNQAARFDRRGAVKKQRIDSNVPFGLAVA